MTQSLSRILRSDVGPTLLAITWVLVAQVVCHVLHDVGMLSRTAGLVDWLAVGVLPAALALAGVPRTAT